MLHYPDGVVSKKIRDSIRPDAFLLKCPQGTAYWVSLKISLNEVTADEAKRNVRQIEIDGQKCDLVYIFPLWHLLQGLDFVNEMMRTLQLPELPYTRYWVKEINFAKTYRGLEWKGRTFCSFTGSQVKKAIALACVSVDDRKMLNTRANEKSADISPNQATDKMVKSVDSPKCAPVIVPDKKKTTSPQSPEISRPRY